MEVTGLIGDTETPSHRLGFAAPSAKETQQPRVVANATPATGGITKRTWVSGDGLKTLYTMPDGAIYEGAGFISTEYERADLCISSMAGCPFACRPCATTYASEPFHRKLTSEELVDQTLDLLAQLRNLKSWRTTKLVRVGFMGNGEALSNWPAVRGAITTLTDILTTRCLRSHEFSISTIAPSTRVLPKISQLNDMLTVPLKLQLSLYSLDEATRRRLLPRATPLATVLTHLDTIAGHIRQPIRYNVPLSRRIGNQETSHLEALARFAAEAPELRRIKLSRLFSVTGGDLGDPDLDIGLIALQLRELGATVDVFLGGEAPNISASCGQLRCYQIGADNAAPFQAS